METTIKEMINAGALRQLCLYHARNAKDKSDWADTRFHAIREFRDVPVKVIDELIEACKLSACIADGAMLNLGPQDDTIKRMVDLLRS